MRPLTSLFLLLFLLITTVSPALAAPPRSEHCEFVLGFKTIHDLIPDRVGECLENERHNPVNGDTLQRTTGGLLVWRKSDNWTAFTDGYHTWVNGPNGLQQRLNTERFPWENDPVTPPGVPTDRATILAYEFWLLPRLEGFRQAVAELPSRPVLQPNGETILQASPAEKEAMIDFLLRLKEGARPLRDPLPPSLAGPIEVIHEFLSQALLDFERGADEIIQAIHTNDEGLLHTGVQRMLDAIMRYDAGFNVLFG